MFFFFVCGTQDFTSGLDGYEQVLATCPRCNHNTASPIKRKTFFTFCFIPIIPLHFGKEMFCSICQYRQKTDEAQLDRLVQNGPMGGYGAPQPHQPPQYAQYAPPQQYK